MFSILVRFRPFCVFSVDNQLFNLLFDLVLRVGYVRFSENNTQAGHILKEIVHSTNHFDLSHVVPKRYIRGGEFWQSAIIIWVSFWILAHFTRLKKSSKGISDLLCVVTFRLFCSVSLHILRICLSLVTLPWKKTLLRSKAQAIWYLFNYI